MRSVRTVLLLTTVLVLGCASPSSRQAPRSNEYGTVIGSVVVELVRAKSSGWGSIFEDDLRTSDPDYELHFSDAGSGWGTPPERVRARRSETKQFVVPLRPGTGRIDTLELVLYDGPAAWFLGAISTTHGTEIPLRLEFPVDPNKINYIGRIKVYVPHLQSLSPKARVIVEDASEDDHPSFEALIENMPLPVQTSLARRAEP